ncbi:MAG: response regulator transcription factor [Myxococcales bacterium]|nr:response regulator transcription factor [Myxococcales bacterium]
MGHSADKTLTRIWRALPAQFGSVVGEEAKLGAIECGREWEPQGRYYYARLELVEPRVCTLYMVFELGLAIACAGRLMVKPDRAIKENIERHTFDGDDVDAMGECVNTFCAALNEGLRHEQGEGWRVVFREGSTTAPDVAALGPLGVGRGKLELGDLARGTFELVIPDAVFVAVLAGDGDDEDDEDEDDDDEDEDDDEDDEDASGEPGAKKAKKKSAKKKKKKKKSSKKGKSAGDDDGDESGGPLLTPEELAAIREATRAAVRGSAMVVAERTGAQAQWKESLAELGIEFEVVANHHQVLAACRQRPVELVVIDADACPAGGLTLLAAIRGGTGVPLRRVVVVSRPTQTHLVACLGGGASEYVCRPLDGDMLAKIVAPSP